MMVQLVTIDQALPSQNAAKLKLKQLRPIYPFMLTDEGTGLRGTPFNVSLKWNVMPRIGTRGSCTA